MIWKIWKKGKLKCEMIWKIWKKDKLNSEMIWKIWKISVLVIITPKEISSSSSSSSFSKLYVFINFFINICSLISPFVLCFPCFFSVSISTSRHNTTNFLSFTQQQQQHFPHTLSSSGSHIPQSSSHISKSSSSSNNSPRRC